MSNLITLNIGGTIEYCCKDILCRSPKLKQMLESKNFVDGTLHINENYHMFMEVLSILHCRSNEYLYINIFYQPIIQRYLVSYLSFNLKRIGDGDNISYKHRDSKNIRHIDKKDSRSKKSNYVYFVGTLNRGELDYFYHLRSIRLNYTNNLGKNIIDDTIRIDVLDNDDDLLYSSYRSGKRLTFMDDYYDSEKLKTLIMTRYQEPNPKDVIRVMVMLNKNYSNVDNIDMCLCFRPYINYVSRMNDNDDVVFYAVMASAIF
jgi:hypothetical protein